MSHFVNRQGRHVDNLMMRDVRSCPGSGHDLAVVGRSVWSKYFVAVCLVFSGIACTTLTAGADPGNQQGQVQGSPAWVASVPPPVPIVSDSVEIIYQVACSGTGACTAVGSYEDASASVRPLLLVEKGTVWSAVTAAVPSGADAADSEILGRVACEKGGSCVAVGQYTNSAGELEAWLLTGSGSSWKLVSPPLPPHTPRTGESVVFGGVGCFAGGCAVVGIYGLNPDTQQGLIVSESRGIWSAREIHAPGTGAMRSLASISCGAAGDCAVVGNTVNASGLADGLTDYETGGHWQAPTLEAPEGDGSNLRLNEVDCPTVGWCAAIGQDSASGNSWMYVTAGHGWSGALLPDLSGRPTSATQLSCGAAASCVVGGASDAQGSNGAAEDVPLIVDYSKGTFAAFPAPLPKGVTAGGGSSISYLACGATCTATETIDNSDNVATHYDVLTGGGKTWGVATLPFPGAGSPIASLGVALACPHQGACVAAGSYSSPTTLNQEGMTIAENGTKWAATQAPIPAGGGVPWEDVLGALTCSPGPDCFAVGVATNIGLPYGPQGEPDAVVDVRNAEGRWSVSLVPLPTSTNKAFQIAMSGISCSSDTNCVAIGSAYTANDYYTPLRVVLAGGRWSASVVRLPTSAAAEQPEPELRYVSCESSGQCIVAGPFQAKPPGAGPLVEIGSGSTWSTVSLPVPSGSPKGALDVTSVSGVSCAGGTCVVPASYQAANVGGGFIDTFTSGKWSSVAAPVGSDAANPPEDGTASASCDAAGTCMVPVGYKNNAGRAETVLAESTNGGAPWEVLSLPQPTGATSPVNGGNPLSCDNTRCVSATGFYTSSGFETDINSVVSGSVSAGVVLPPGGAYPANSYLYGASCDGNGLCALVGSAWFPNAQGEGWLLTGSNGSGWTSVLAPLPWDARTSKQQVSLPTVSCLPSGVCVADGTYVGSGSRVEGLIETYS